MKKSQPRQKKLNLFEKCRVFVEKDKINLIYLDNDDFDFVSKEVLKYLNNKFPNRRFVIQYKCSNQIKYFKVSEILDFVDENLLSVTTQVSLCNIFMESILNMLDTYDKSKLLAKYSYQTNDFFRSNKRVFTII